MKKNQNNASKKAFNINDKLLNILKKHFLSQLREYSNVIMGIRENTFNFYKHGKEFLKLEYKKNKVIAAINSKYGFIPNISDDDPKYIKKWASSFHDLMDAVDSYDEKKNYEGAYTHHLYKYINDNENDYFVVDVESQINANKLRYNKFGKVMYSEKGNVRTKKAGKIDLLVMSKPVNNETTIYYVEVKYGKNAYNSSMSDGLFGSGIVGHFNDFGKLIYLINNNKNYVKYNGLEISVKHQVEELIRFNMNIYKDFGFLDHKKHFKNVDYDSIRIKEAKLIFYLGNYEKKSKTEEAFNKHTVSNYKYSIRSILKSELSELFIKEKQIHNILVYKATDSVEKPDYNLKFDDFDKLRY